MTTTFAGGEIGGEDPGFMRRVLCFYCDGLSFVFFTDSAIGLNSLIISHFLQNSYEEESECINMTVMFYP